MAWWAGELRSSCSIHVTFDQHGSPRIRTIDSSLVVRNCAFTDMFAARESLHRRTTQRHVWGRGVPCGGRFILDGNVFGRTPATTLLISTARHDPMRSRRSSTMSSSAGATRRSIWRTERPHHEGNVFMDYIEDRFNKTRGARVERDFGRCRPGLVRVRNVFRQVEHVAQIKDRAFMWFENNTVVDANAAVFYFEIPGQTTSPGRGVRIDSCIFRQCPTLLGDLRVNDAEWGTTDIAVDRCLLPSDWHALGEGNIDADPLFAGDGDFHLKPWSAARGAGMLGLDMGAFVPRGPPSPASPRAGRIGRR